MLNDQALNRLYEAMGIAGDDPMMVGRQRRIKAAIEAAYPDIRTSVAAEVAGPIIDAYCEERDDAMELDTSYHRSCRALVIDDLERVIA